MDIGVLRVEVPEPRLHRKLRVAGPSVLLAVRTVRRDSDEVGKVAPLRRRLERGESCVRRLQRPDTVKRRMDEPRPD